MEQLLLQSQNYIEMEYVEILRTFMTNLVSDDLSSDKCLYFYGNGPNGKTTFLNLIIEFIGESNICYNDQALDRKLRIFPEIENINDIKKFTSNDKIYMREPYKKKIKINKCMCICVGHVLPDNIIDKDLLNRLIPIEFKRKFF